MVGQASHLTLPDVLRSAATDFATSTAILAPGRLPLTYERLFAHISETLRTFNAFGIGHNDRVAIVAPNSAETVVAILAIKSAATCITLNPGYSEGELKTLLRRLKPKAVLIPDSLDTLAWHAAAELGIPVITVMPCTDQAAGLFALRLDRSPYPAIPADDARGGFAQPNDIVQLVMTSGTASTPKIVPYIHKRAFPHTRLIGEWIGLTPQDRLLCFLPMYHLIGMSYVQQALMFGGSVVCLPGFDVKTFFQSLSEYQATWFAAVTPMYQALLDQASSYRELLAHCSVRRMVAPSIAIDERRSAALEALFNAPLIQTYGATEVAQVSANPMPPKMRKLGSAGLPSTEVGVIGDDLNLLPSGSTGEIVVRGPAVMDGYLDDPLATARVFVNGWYRTGDVGYVDSDGYLFIMGRLDEVINRGGQKVSPTEVEQALLAHPAVVQAVAFAIPDVQLGSEVAAAVVLHSGATLSERELRRVASKRLALYKIPRRIAFLDEIPKTALGKEQRTKLARQLGWDQLETESATDFTPPRNDIEGQLALLWADVLGCSATDISVHARFADMGGTSLNAAHLIFRSREAFKVSVSIVDFFNAATIAEQANVVEELLRDSAGQARDTYLVSIQPQGTLPPLYCLPPIHGAVYVYQPLLPYLSPHQPVYGLLAVGIDDGREPLNSIEAMAAHHVQQIKSVQSQGPYYLCGYSFGGRVALETARLLRQEGHLDTYVLIIDDILQISGHGRHELGKHSLGERFDSLRFAFMELDSVYRRHYLRQHVRSCFRPYLRRLRRKNTVRYPKLAISAYPITVQRVTEAGGIAARQYSPPPYDGAVRYLRAVRNKVNIPFFKMLRQLFTGDFVMRNVPGHHLQLLELPHVEVVGREIQDWLNSLYSLH